MKYTKIPETTFENLVLNAGILVDSFTKSTGTIGNIIGATTGGIQFNATPSFSDFGEDIDNCPKNTKELKRLDDWEIKMSGTFVTVTASLGKKLVALADIDSTDTSKIVPRATLKSSDYGDVWFIGDYSDINDDSTGGDKAGYIAVHMMNALSTGGFQIQTGDKEKGQFAFEFTAHYSIDEQTTVPFEVYVVEGVEG